MGRRKKGRPVHGWLIVDKPEGVTSTQVVGRARWAFDAQKAGHSGTLDPFATGLLAVAFGEATKTVPYAQEGEKTYHFTVRWGQATTSDDREGEVCATSDLRPSAAEIEAALPSFRGEIMQTPPLFSAVKVDGERAYDIARRGDTAELKARPLTVHKLELLKIIDADHAVIEMVCGKGGYVRSIARDLGEALGCHAHVASLRRHASGGFDLEGALGFEALEALKEDPERDDHLLAVEEGMGDAPEYDVPASLAARLDHGDNSAVPVINAPVYWLSYNGDPLAIVEREGAAPPKLKRVFRFDDAD